MIYFLDSCQDYSVLSTILFLKNVFEIICFVAPIILIIMAAFEVSRIVFNPDGKVVSNVMTKTIHKFIAAIGIFFVPVLVNLLLNLLDQTNIKASTCWTQANIETINVYKEAAKKEEELEQQKLREEKKRAEDERKIREATREIVRGENEKAAEKAREASKYSSGLASDAAARFVQIAQNEYNSINHSVPLGRPNKYTNAYGYSAAWCAMFVWWCAREAGLWPNKLSIDKGAAAGVLYWRQFFESGRNGTRWERSAHFGGNYRPKMGDIIIFTWSSVVNGHDHIGIVKGISGDRVLIIDGNYGNTIQDRSLPLNNSNIAGYGVWE